MAVISPDFDKSQTLSVSDVELGFKPVSETYSSNNLRLRRILEDSDLFQRHHA